MNKKLWAPVLYLGFDGVLHPDGTLALDEGFHILDNPALFEWLPTLLAKLRDHASKVGGYCDVHYPEASNIVVCS